MVDFPLIPFACLQLLNYTQNTASSHIYIFTIWARNFERLLDEVWLIQGCRCSSLLLADVYCLTEYQSNLLAQVAKISAQVDKNCASDKAILWNRLDFFVDFPMLQLIPCFLYNTCVFYIFSYLVTLQVSLHFFQQLLWYLSKNDKRLPPPPPFIPVMLYVWMLFHLKNIFDNNFP